MSWFTDNPVESLSKSAVYANNGAEMMSSQSVGKEISRPSAWDESKTYRTKKKNQLKCLFSDVICKVC